MLQDIKKWEKDQLTKTQKLLDEQIRKELDKNVKDSYEEQVLVHKIVEETVQKEVMKEYEQKNSNQKLQKQGTNRYLELQQDSNLRRTLTLLPARMA